MIDFLWVSTLNWKETTATTNHILKTMMPYSQTKKDSNDEDSTSIVKKKISPELEEFYASHNIELSSLLQETSSKKNDRAAAAAGYRFVRLNPRYDRNETLTLLQEELGKNNDKVEPIPVPWLDDAWGFYAIPQNFALSTSKSFQLGRVYGMDVSSGAAIAVLLSKLYDKNTGNNKVTYVVDSSSNGIRALDLCCCPGLKLCGMADFLRGKNATVVGVDLSELRMNLCKKIVTKYHIDLETCGSSSAKDNNMENMKIQLFCQDGTSFGMNPDNLNLVFDSRSAIEEISVRGKRKRMNKSARTRERKRLKAIVNDEIKRITTQQEGPIIQLFDYVLVDAECSTDGSLKHMKERLKDDEANREESNTLLTDQTRLADLVDLQRRLIQSGFRLLKSGGSLVYSTCSLSHDQNEKVVQWLLESEPKAFLIPVAFPLAKSKLVAEGSLKGTVRFYPNICGESSTEVYGDGFFLAKLGKK